MKMVEFIDKRVYCVSCVISSIFKNKYGPLVFFYIFYIFFKILIYILIILKIFKNFIYLLKNILLFINTRIK